MLKGFKQFILRGNVVDLAVGVVIGASFGTVVSSLVKDILTPFISVIFKSPDFSGLAFTIKETNFMYGNFLNALIAFLIVSVAVYFFVVTPINTLIAKSRKEKPLDETTKKCTECLSEIPIEAKRCAHCTSVLK
ncbi:MAG: large conductance mechanosensitive channel protein MscL [Candidatus Paceibacterota bacterium]|jgi:large conductance mechanosensitive channel